MDTDAAFAVTFIGDSNDLADRRMFYWSTSGRGNTAVLKDAYYTRSGRGKRGSGNNNNHDAGRWKSDRLSTTVSYANLGGLAATSWTRDGKVRRKVFYIREGDLRELTLDECDEGHGHGHHGDGWEDEDRDGVELHIPFWRDQRCFMVRRDKGRLGTVFGKPAAGPPDLPNRQRPQRQNQSSRRNTWSDVTPYTTANNLYSTSFIEPGAGSSAASLQVSHGKPNLYLWTVGPQGGAVKEDDERHGRNAKAGTQLAAATLRGLGGASYVFFLNKDGRLTQSNRDREGRWHENLLAKMQNGR
ncbi:hypothetical protein FS837_002622 [Tulasnella sp. UAMH 9824]|nr:hypothetical protein FS837_002622 [Tulasnella sp. UAMH 9824]